MTVVTVHSSESISSAHRELQRVTDAEPAEMALKWAEMLTCFQKKNNAKISYISVLPSFYVPVWPPYPSDF